MLLSFLRGIVGGGAATTTRTAFPRVPPTEIVRFSTLHLELSRPQMLPTKELVGSDSVQGNIPDSNIDIFDSLDSFMPFFHRLSASLIGGLPSMRLADRR